MAISITDRATEHSVRELAAATGDSFTTAIRKAVEERLQRVRAVRAGRGVKEDLLAIGRHCAALPDRRTGDETLDYDSSGLPR